MSIVGRKPNQVPTNNMLGSMAYQDADVLDTKSDTSHTHDDKVNVTDLVPYDWNSGVSTQGKNYLSWTGSAFDGWSDWTAGGTIEPEYTIVNVGDTSVKFVTTGLDLTYISFDIEKFTAPLPAGYTISGIVNVYIESFSGSPVMLGTPGVQLRSFNDNTGSTTTAYMGIWSDSSIVGSWQQIKWSITLTDISYGFRIYLFGAYAGNPNGYFYGTCYFDSPNWDIIPPHTHLEAEILDLDKYTQTEINDFFSGTTPITGYNNTNWDTAYGWGDWSTGVDKTFVDALGVNADTVDSAHVGTSGATIPLLNGTNTWSGTQTFGDTIALQTTTTAGHTFSLSAYDTTGVTYVDLITLTAGTSATLTIDWASTDNILRDADAFVDSDDNLLTAAAVRNVIQQDVQVLSWDSGFSFLNQGYLTWNGSGFDGWGMNGDATQETTITNTGTSAKIVGTGSVNTIIHEITEFTSYPLPPGYRLEGIVPIYIESFSTSPHQGAPGISIYLYTDPSLTVYDSIQITSDPTIIGEWQYLPVYVSSSSWVYGIRWAIGSLASFDYGHTYGTFYIDGFKYDIKPPKSVANSGTSQVCSVYASTSVDLPNSATPIPFDTAQVMDSIFTFPTGSPASPGVGAITVLKTGKYEITQDFSSYKTADNATRRTTSASIYVDGVEITGTTAYTYNRTTGPTGYGSTSATVILDLTANQYIQIMGMCTQAVTGETATVANECRLNIKYLP